MRVLWSENAELSFIEIIDQLDYKWGKQYIEKFVLLTENKCDQLIKFPQIGVTVDKELHVRKVLIHETVSLFYQLDNEKKIIKLLFFWANRKDPKSLSKLLPK